MSQALRHTPLRRCVLCRQNKSPDALIRFYQSEVGWQLDKHHLMKGQKNRPPKPYGRGAWICLDRQCHDPKALKRFFKQDAESLAELLNLLLSPPNPSYSLSQAESKDSL